MDVVTGGFPCQSFSYAGKKLGLNDARGTLFYEFARAVQEIQPLIALGENVRIQTFPDDWEFMGSQYKQIGNAVPVNLAYHVGVELVRSLNEHHLI